uniref:Histone chaperone RTT106/FACT complex subunit SPT16-like middle domain-containing protein n=1 Tax=Oncorhynchus mykiss TaxID=8022 RepID=A0A8K9XP68_ONCMY
EYIEATSQDISQEVKTSTVCQQFTVFFPRMTYKSRKTGKVDSIPSVELSQAQWRRVCLGQGIKLTTSTRHQVDHHGAVRRGGWNWGTAKTRELCSLSLYIVKAFLIFGSVTVVRYSANVYSLFRAKYHSSVPTIGVPSKPTIDFVSLSLSHWYDIYPSFLHGKTFDYKMYFWCGQTRYHFLILLFSKEEDLSLSLNMTEEEVEKRYEGKLSKNMSDSLYEMVSRVMKALVNRKITAQCITCSYKAGFVHIHKPPPVHLCRSVNFARGTTTTTTRSLDFEIENQAGHPVHPSAASREEYGKLFDFVTAEKLSIKNRGFKEGMKGKDDMLEDSDEDQHDAYLERMKEEGKIREEANDSDDSDGESDESFNPGEEDDDITEEYVLVFNPSLPYIYRFFSMFSSVNLFHFPLSLLILPPSL